MFVDLRDLDDVAAAKEKSGGQIDSMEEDPTDIENPISVSLDLQRLYRSTDPEQRSLADLITAISEFRGEVSNKFDEVNSNVHRGSNREIQERIV